MWTLVLYIYAGVMARGDSVTLLSVPNFQTEQACKEAGDKSRPLVAGSFKELRFVCLPTASISALSR